MIGQITRIAAFILIPGFLFSCATKPPQARQDAAQALEIQDIRITEGNGKTIIEIEGGEAMIYTTFQLTDPNRLIIDIAGVGLGKFDQEIQLESGPIRTIRPVSGGGSNVTRLELLLDETVEAVVSSDGVNLVIDAAEAGRMKSKFVFFADEAEPPTETAEETVEVRPEEIAKVGPEGIESSEAEIDLTAALPVPQLNESALAAVADSPLEQGTEEVIEMEESAEAVETRVGMDSVSSASAIEESPELSSEPLEATGQDRAVTPENLSGETAETLSMSSTEKTLSAPSGLPSELLMTEATEPPPLVPMPGLFEIEDREPEPSLEKAIAESPEALVETSPAFLEDPLDSPLENPDLPGAVEETEEISVAREPPVEILLTEIPVAKIEASVEKPVALEKPLPVAKRVKSIQFVKGEDLRLVITSDGLLRPRVFRVDKKRIAIDLPGVKTVLKRPIVLERDPLVTRVRIGQHPKKLRLVVDLASAVSYTWQQKQENLELTFRDPSSPPKQVEPTEVATLASDLRSPPGPSIEGEAIKDPPASVKQVKPAEVAVVAPELSPLPTPGPSIEDKAITTLPPPLFVDIEKPLEDSPDQHLEAQAGGGEAAPAPEPLIVPIASSSEEDAAAKAAAEEKKVVEEKRKKRLRKKTFLRQRQEEKTDQGKNLFVQKKKSKEDPLDSQPTKYVGKKISLDFQDAEITNVIRLIADVSRLNFVMGEDVKGKVSLKLANVPWDQALDIILEMNNLGKVRQGNIIRIATLTNLANQRDEVARAKETEVNSADLVTRVIYVNYGKADEAEILLNKLLSPRGEIMVDKRTNAMIVKDIEENLEQIERLAQKLDTKTPQVLIEARIAEVKPTFKRSLGVKWGADFKTTQGGNIIGVGNAAADSTFNAPTPDFAVNLPANNNLGGVGFTFGRFSQSPFSLDLRLSAGEVQGMTRIVSTPKIMVLDNHEATIEQGQSIPFQTSSGNEGTKTEFVDAKLTLKVTPHISPDGGILLEVLLTKNEPALTIEDKAPGPRIFKKEISTKILLMDGETMVIGGIYETQKSKTESGIPFLKDLPAIGWLFKNKESAEETSELLVFITPAIMDKP